MRKLIFLFLIMMILFHPGESIAKTGGEQAKIWINAGITASGIGNMVKIGKALVRIFKPEAVLNWMEWAGEVEKGRRRIDDVQEKMDDPTGAGWLLWSATTAAEVGSSLLETAVPAVRISKAVLDVGYQYYRNWQDEWMEELKEMPEEPYTPILLPPALPLPIAPGRDHPDDYKGVIDSRPATPPADELQRLLKEYDDLSLNYLAFEVGMSIDDPVCDYQMQKFVSKLKNENPDYELHLQETEKLSEDAYNAAYEVQKKVCLLYYGTITETTEFPHFKTQQEVINFLNSLTPQQRQEVLALQKIFFDKMKIAVEGEKKIYEDIRKAVDVGIMYYGFPDELVNLLNSLEVSNATFWDEEKDLSKGKDNGVRPRKQN